MAFVFEVQKAAQVIAAFLSLAPQRRMNYVKLMKLLYILDREGLRETGTSITGAAPVAMGKGPVLSEIYDLIRERAELDAPEQWQRYFIVAGYNIELLEDPGRDELSEYEESLIAGLSDKYRDLDQWKLVDLTHTFPEWQRNNPSNSSRPIPLNEILESVGHGAEAVKAIMANASEDQLLDRIFRSE